MMTVCRQRDEDYGTEEKWEPDVSVPPIVSENPDENDAEQNDFGGRDVSNTRDTVMELCKQQGIPSDLELQLQEYFKDHPRMKPLPLSDSSSVDIDLADSDEETWIIQVPATINVEADLIAKKINLAATRSTIKNCSVPLEAHVQTNSGERVIGLMAGSRVKSFVPTGFVRISQALPAMAVPDEFSKVNNPNHITVPYPEEIRERHPLLGYDFNEHMALPKHVRKHLSFAQQKADLMYKNVGKSPKKKGKTAVRNTVDSTPAASEQRMVVTPGKRVPPGSESVSKIKNRKRPLVETEKVEVSMVTVKQEPLSPKRKKSKHDEGNDDVAQTVSVKKEVSVEDDISWLLNI
uniref:Uncharacterized protein n=1 Tax=Anopheles maculatus TaxID=74869 RepID=A0A182S625_9DIPT